MTQTVNNLSTDSLGPSEGYMFCFQTACPSAEKCIHYFAGQHTGDLESGLTVFPAAIKGGRCTWYKTKREMNGAWGFNALFEDVKAKDAPALRLAIKRYVGSTYTYYRIHHGQQLLTPEQQTWIIALFRRYGYTGELHFDGYRTVFDW